MNADQIIVQLKSQADPAAVEGMVRYGINPENTLGISIPTLRAMAREIGKDHQLAEELWASGIHEARILASIIDDPHQVTEEQMERWVADFDSWDVCDQVCSNLFDRTTFAYQKAIEWSSGEAEFIKRAGFAMMAALAVHDKRAGDERFEPFFPIIVRQATDERNYVKKAVNWALRNIGKRNRHLNTRTIEIARKIEQIDSKVARWIANDALKELTDDRIQSRF
ncbi:MAG: DNA alkylation repair protein [Chloroflexi bacterium RBG_19FT_COMBO_55_16]|nr:MAG: DNA alkylation repair protein [Chloroflexi bacterium RBG_19FT_COMBO_55_16]